MGRLKALKTISNQDEIYARPDGWHYHLTKDCMMLAGGEFERFGYKRIEVADIKRRKLIPCVCAYSGFVPVGGKG